MSDALSTRITRLEGPILVLGASGFVGANLLRTLLAARNDVVGTASRLPAWRLAGIADRAVAVGDLLVRANLTALLDRVEPRTVFNCTAYGAYPFERDVGLIHRTSYELTVHLLEELASRGRALCIQAGSSSEYGVAAAGPGEETAPRPNSHYAVAKAAASAAVGYMGRERGLPCAVLRLYSVYGPYEEPSRLIPTLVARGVEGALPELVDPAVGRDFVYVDDICEAFIAAALHLDEEHYGAAFNIGTGRCTTICEVAEIARRLFGIDAEPRFTMPRREWDVDEWYASIERAREVLGWAPRTSFEEGLRRTTEWYVGLEDRAAYLRATKRVAPGAKRSLSAVVACYRDEEAIPIMHERLTRVLSGLGLDYEIIFVNDGSPDRCEEVIRGLSEGDRRVLGISHSRNFGSQAAFVSGLELASKEACVLLDGDLQDPPELIEQMVERWRDGADVVFGRRVDRRAPWFMRLAYKLFYRLLALVSYVDIPRDAGDFSLIDRRVVRALLRFEERELFLRGLRAYVGFRQEGVDYVRPARMFGRSTNSLLRNLAWAKKGILSFSNAPLNLLTALGTLSLLLFAVLGAVQAASKLVYPESAPHGITTVILVVLLVGSLNLLAISVVGQYISRIFTEVKRRPRFVRRSIIRDGEVRDLAEEAAGDG